MPYLKLFNPFPPPILPITAISLVKYIETYHTN